MPTEATQGFLGISLESWLTILAIIVGPILALALQRNSERRRSAWQRKETIFKELMATRAAKLSERHVDALNAIEIEFSGKRRSDKAVSAAWRMYLDHLNDSAWNLDDRDTLARWLDKGNDLLTDLLYEMSKALKYDFDKVSLKKAVYSPRAHGELQTEQFLLRKYVLEMMEGKRGMWTGVFTGERPLKMEIVSPVVVNQTNEELPPLPDIEPPR